DETVGAPASTHVVIGDRHALKTPLWSRFPGTPGGAPPRRRTLVEQHRAVAYGARRRSLCFLLPLAPEFIDDAEAGRLPRRLGLIAPQLDEQDLHRSDATLPGCLREKHQELVPVRDLSHGRAS